METEMELIARIHVHEQMRTVTPYGDECITAPVGSPLNELISGEARGRYQRNVTRNLAENGYIIGYLADGGPLRGRAGNYKGKYEKSLHNFAERINEKLPGRFHLVYDRVGPKGAWGYRLTDEI